MKSLKLKFKPNQGLASIQSPVIRSSWFRGLMASPATTTTAVGCDDVSKTKSSGSSSGNDDTPVKGVAYEAPPAETGSSAASAETTSSPTKPRRTPVGHETPNIPNVVEYHLKVKPQPANTARHNGTVSGYEMKKEQSKPSLTEEQRKELTLRLSKLSVDSNVFEGSSDLPQVFQVKYLGSHDARGLWGIKHIRKPVDNMVAAAKALPTGTILPFIKLVISEDGVGLLPLGKRRADSISKIYPIESISYGVQDLVYTRVFSMIIVRETEDFRRLSPFECHAFVCESKHHARQMTYALAAAFQIYSQHVKERTEDPVKSWSKGFAIDLRNSNEIEADFTLNPEE
ncbi:uncharacterized protein LOC131673033 isoform X2 [Phymastichus coffea]|uniref:uncharacterized protein LOC131673033 isoform X2 n=1 Tax=Phymastichus coffea TaxID=108790 RepID=UPI00273CDA29|nr:uncharacterized protein LOC131673033 isoform X2 [Phymastichus coffea]